MRWLLVPALLILASAPGARAGGASFGSDDNSSGSLDAGPTFYGFVKTSGGDVVDGAKITVTVKSLNSSMVLHTDSQGHFMARGFDKSVNPNDVEVACSKEGFREVEHVRKPMLYPNAPIEVDCILDHQ